MFKICCCVSDSSSALCISVGALLGRMSGPELLMKVLSESLASSRTVCGPVTHGVTGSLEQEAKSAMTCTLQRYSIT